MKPTDKDLFGNVGSMYPNDKYRIFISSSQNVSMNEVKWLKGCEDNFKAYKIEWFVNSISYYIAVIDILDYV